MNSYDFIVWLKGFVQAANSYNITPKQWDDIKEQLNKVNSTPATKYTLEDNNNVSLSNWGFISDTTYKQDELTTNTVF
jgi:hypothetical protein